MNRWDQIQARNTASNVHIDPEAKDKLATDLTQLIRSVAREVLAKAQERQEAKVPEAEKGTE